MRRGSLIRQRLAALSFVGLLLFFSPLVGLFDQPLVLAGGIPLLYLYLFGAWGFIIALSIWILGPHPE